MMDKDVMLPVLESDYQQTIEHLKSLNAEMLAALKTAQGHAKNRGNYMTLLEETALAICKEDAQDWVELGKTYNGRQEQGKYRRFAACAIRLVGNQEDLDKAKALITRATRESGGGL